MNRKIELLTFLYERDAVHKPQNITQKLKELGYIEYEQVRQFLDHLLADNYIDWEDVRPKYKNLLNNMVPKMDAKPDYEAKIKILGIDLVEERKLKLDSVRIAKRANRIAFSSLIVALLAAGFSIYQWNLIKTNSDIRTDRIKRPSATKPKSTKTMSDHKLPDSTHHNIKSKSNH